MIKINEYFEGRVKSLGLQVSNIPATIGVISKGEYEFGTAQKEIMRIQAGTLEVLLPGESVWRAYQAGQSFEVAPHQKFKVKAEADVAYLCEYY